MHARASVLWGLLCLCAIYGFTQWWLPRALPLHDDLAFSLRRGRMAEQLEASPGVPLVALLGSSRTLMSWDGAAAEEEFRRHLHSPAHVVNFAIPGGSVVNSFVVLGDLLRVGPAPDMVVIEVFPAFLAQESKLNLYNCADSVWSADDWQWLGQHGILPPEDQKPRALTGLALIDYRTDILRRIAPRLAPQAPKWLTQIDSWGSITSSPPPSAAQRQLALSVAERDYSEGLAKFHTGSPGMRALRGMLHECRDRQIAVTLVMMPEGPAFRQWYPPGAREEIVNAVEQLVDSYPCQFVNAWEWFDESGFGDSHHLLAHTGRELSRRVSREVSRQWRSPKQLLARERITTKQR
jgi:hypothetical protein